MSIAQANTASAAIINVPITIAGQTVDVSGYVGDFAALMKQKAEEAWAEILGKAMRTGAGASPSVAGARG
jgi:hypothetical protein